MKHTKTIAAVVIATLFTLVCAFQIHAQAAGQRHTITGKVLSVTDEGLLIQCRTSRTSKEVVPSTGMKYAGGVVHLTGHPDTKKLVDGSAVSCVGTLSGPYGYNSAGGAKKTVEQFAFASKLRN